MMVKKKKRNKKERKNIKEKVDQKKKKITKKIGILGAGLSIKSIINLTNQMMKLILRVTNK